MKKIIFILTTLLLSSCSSYIYYQVLKTTPISKEMNVTVKGIVYEDINCIITYNLWSEGGNIGFKFYNKTDNDIYLNLEKCFFVKNGEANTYFRNRTFTSSNTVGSSQSIGISGSKSVTGYNYLDLLQTNSKSANSSVASVETNGAAVSYGELKVVCIPSKTYKIIKEYKILENTFRDCDLIRYPGHNEIKAFTFTIENSPVVCSNEIEYKVGLNSSAINIENKFYISEITNYPEDEIIKRNEESYCDETISNPGTISYFKNSSVDKFVIKYYKQGENRYNYKSISNNTEIKTNVIKKDSVIKKTDINILNKKIPEDNIFNELSININDKLKVLDLSTNTYYNCTIKEINSNNMIIEFSEKDKNNPEKSLTVRGRIRIYDFNNQKYFNATVLEININTFTAERN